MAVTSGTDGMVVGTGPGGRPVVVRLVTAAPMLGCLIGDVVLGRIIALRAVALGARVVVHTARPAQWLELTRLTGGADVVAVLALGEPAPRAAPGQPLLVVHDGGAAPDDVAPATAPWQTTLVLLPFVDHRALGHLAHADLLATTRLAQSDVATLREQPALLTVADRAGDLDPDEVLWSGGGRQVVARLVPTTVEQGLATAG